MEPGSPQVNSCLGVKVDIEFFQHQSTSWVIHTEGAPQEQTWSPSSTRQRHWVTFAKGRATLPGESPRHGAREHPCDARAEMGYQLPPPMWQTEATPQEMADWLRPREEAQTILVEEDIDLKCPSPLEPHLQQLLGEEELSPVGVKVEMDSCPCQHQHQPHHHCHVKIQSPYPCASQS